MGAVKAWDSRDVNNVKRYCTGLAFQTWEVAAYCGNQSQGTLGRVLTTPEASLCSSPAACSKQPASCALALGSTEREERTTAQRHRVGERRGKSRAWAKFAPSGGVAHVNKSKRHSHALPCLFADRLPAMKVVQRMTERTKMCWHRSTVYVCYRDRSCRLSTSPFGLVLLLTRLLLAFPLGHLSR